MLICIFYAGYSLGNNWYAAKVERSSRIANNTLDLYLKKN